MGYVFTGTTDNVAPQATAAAASTGAGAGSAGK